MPKRIRGFTFDDLCFTVSARLKLKYPELTNKEIRWRVSEEYGKYYRIEQIEEYTEYWNTIDERGMDSDKKTCIKEYQY